MLTRHAPNVFAVSGVLTPDECEALIERGESLGFEAAAVTTTAGPKMMTNIRNNDRVMFHDAEYADGLWQRVRGHVPAEFDGASVVGLNERFRFYRYDPSQRFRAHVDGSVERSPTERSRLTFMIYLNEGFEGGHTVFYSDRNAQGRRDVLASVAPVAGMGLIFAHEWWHEGAAVVSGRKYVLRTDVMYRSDTAQLRT